MSGIEKQIDDLGRVVLPINFRKKVGMENKARVLITLKGRDILITSLSTHCALCGSNDNLNTDIKLCGACIEKIKQL